MPEESLDQIIQRKLETLAFSPEPGEWEAFLDDHLIPQERNDAFDLQLRSSMAQLHFDALPGDWADFSAQLTEAFPESGTVRALHEQATTPLPEPTPNGTATEYDLQLLAGIREKLLSLRVPYREGDWAVLASQLDGNPLDQIIRQKVAAMEMAPQPEDWQALATALDAPAYAQMQEKLHDLQVPYRAADWRLFSRQWLRHRPWYLEWRNYASVAAVLLLCLSLFPWIKGKLPAESIPLVQDAFLANRNSPERPESAPARIPANDTPPRNTAPADRPAEAAATSPNHGVTADSQQAASSNLTIAPVSAQLPVTATIHQAPGPRSLSDATPESAASPLRRMPVQNGVLSLAHPQRPDAPTILPGPGKSIIQGVQVGVYSAMGRTRAELSSDATKRGFALGLRSELILNDQISLVTGIFYEDRSFLHSSYAFTSSFRRIENLVDARMQLIELPLLLRHYFPNTKAVRLYVQSGVVPMISIKESYQLYQDWRGDLPAPGLQSNSNLRLPDPSKGQLRSLETYVANLYGGAGLDWAINSRWHAQLEPYFLISLQKTRGSGALGIEKRMYHTGLGFAILYRL